MMTSRSVSRPKIHPVPRTWPGQTFVCLASGPSMTQADADVVRGRARVIAINRTIELAPWAAVWYACDAKFWKWAHRGDIGPTIKGLTTTFAGPKYAMTAGSLAYPGITLLGKGPSQGLSLDPLKVCLGGNSGYQAINLAVLMGASRILLLGYDMGISAGRQHWHADHPIRQRSPYQTFLQAYPTLVKPLADAGVEIINCSRETRLSCFPRMTIDQALPMLQQESVA